MTVQPPIAGEQLANALAALDVRFVLGGDGLEATLNLHPARLIAALAASDEARLRLALIPLFLQHPEFSAQARAAVQNLNSTQRITLMCYYTAAYLIQQRYRARLDALSGEKATLPDLFSNELGLVSADDPDLNLKRLAERHTALSAAQVNWLGTYQHAIQKWLSTLERRRP